MKDELRMEREKAIVAASIILPEVKLRGDELRAKLALKENQANHAFRREIEFIFSKTIIADPSSNISKYLEYNPTAEIVDLRSEVEAIDRNYIAILQTEQSIMMTRAEDGQFFLLLSPNPPPLEDLFERHIDDGHVHDYDATHFFF